jgi:hypothetical protein
MTAGQQFVVAANERKALCAVPAAERAKERLPVMFPPRRRGRPGRPRSCPALILAGRVENGPPAFPLAGPTGSTRRLNSLDRLSRLNWLDRLSWLN